MRRSTEYDLDMEQYRNMTDRVEELRREAKRTSGYKRKELLKETKELEWNAARYRRTPTDLL